MWPVINNLTAGSIARVAWTNKPPILPIVHMHVYVIVDFVPRIWLLDEAHLPQRTALHGIGPSGEYDSSKSGAC
jgi:hypothetical protein